MRERELVKEEEKEGEQLEKGGWKEQLKLEKEVEKERKKEGEMGEGQEEEKGEGQEGG